MTYKKVGRDVRGEIEIDPNVDLPDYSGPFRADLRFSDFSEDQLVRMLSMSHEYYVLLVEAWAAEIGTRKGDDAMQDLQTSAWTNGVLPHVPRITEEWTAFDDVDGMPELGSRRRRRSARSSPMPRYADCDKERLVNLLLGSHEFLLLVIESWAAEVVVRYSLDEMFEIQWALWSAKVLPEVRRIKGKWMNITTNDVAAFMKDIQIDATSYPGQGLRADLRDAGGRRRHHDVQQVLRTRSVGSARTTGHPREELPLHLSCVVDRDGEDVQPEHEGRHPRDPASHR